MVANCLKVKHFYSFIIYIECLAWGVNIKTETIYLPEKILELELILQELKLASELMKWGIDQLNTN